MVIKILFIGNFNEKLDEGFSQISHKFYEYFKERYEALSLNTFDVLKIDSIKLILKFKPTIIHYLTGPTLKSFIILWILNYLLGNKPKTVVSATRPFLREVELKIVWLFKPDLVLVQAKKWANIFNKNNFNTSFIPNPIDLERFKKLYVSKNKLRKKFNLPSDKKLLLHVGHISSNRNLNFLVEIQKHVKNLGYQIVIVGSTYFKPNKEIYNKLVKSGCIVFHHYISNIVEIYNACDFYIFPISTLSRSYLPKRLNEVGVIDMPLTILEAIACNLPVITPKIDALEVLINGEQFSPVIFYEGTKESFLEKLNIIRNLSHFNYKTIQEFISHKNVFDKVEKHYKRLIGN